MTPKPDGKGWTWNFRIPTPAPEIPFKEPLEPGKLGPGPVAAPERARPIPKESKGAVRRRLMKSPLINTIIKNGGIDLNIMENNPDAGEMEEIREAFRLNLLPPGFFRRGNGMTLGHATELAGIPDDVEGFAQRIRDELHGKPSPPPEQIEDYAEAEGKRQEEKQAEYYRGLEREQERAGVEQKRTPDLGREKPFELEREEEPRPEPKPEPLFAPEEKAPAPERIEPETIVSSDFQKIAARAKSEAKAGWNIEYGALKDGRFYLKYMGENKSGTGKIRWRGLPPPEFGKVPEEPVQETLDLDTKQGRIFEKREVDTTPVTPTGKPSQRVAQPIEQGRYGAPEKPDMAPLEEFPLPENVVRRTNLPHEESPGYETGLYTSPFMEPSGRHPYEYAGKTEVGYLVNKDAKVARIENTEEFVNGLVAFADSALAEKNPKLHEALGQLIYRPGVAHEEIDVDSIKKILKTNYPDVDWDKKLHAAAEIVGAKEARKSGYDAIYYINRDNPQKSEYIGLTGRAFKKSFSRLSERPAPPKKFDPEDLPEIFKKLAIPREDWGELTEYVLKNYKPEKEVGGIESYIRKKLAWRAMGPPRPKKVVEVPIEEGITEEPGAREGRPTPEPERITSEREQEAFVVRKIKDHFSRMPDEMAERNSRIFMDYWMAPGQAQPSIEEMGEKYGLSHQQIRNIITEATAKLSQDPEVAKFFNRTFKLYSGIGIDKDAIKTMSTWVREMLGSRAGVTEEIDIENDHRIAAIMADKFEATLEAKKIKKFIKENGGLNVESLIWDILFEGIPYDTYAFPEDIKNSLKAMRDRIDNLSLELVTHGDLPPGLAGKIYQNIGRYYHRSYKLYEYQDRAKGKMPWRRKYWAPSQQAIDKFTNMLRRLYPETFGTYTKGEMENFVDAEIHGKPNQGWSKSFGASRKTIDTEILKRRIQLTPEWKEFAGEIRDPVWIYLDTVTKVSFDAHNAKLLDMVATNYEDDLWTRDEDLARKWGWQKNRLREEKRLGSLAGSWCHPTLYEYFTGEYDKLNASATERLFEKWLFVPYKVSKTILSYPTHVRNFVGNTMFSMILRNSVLQPANIQYYKKAIDVMLGSTSSHKTEWADLVRQGVTETQYMGNEIPMFYKEMMELEPQDWFDSMINFLIKRPMNFLGKLYNAEDALFRIAAHYKNIDYFHMTPDESLDEINRGMTNYRKLPRAVAWLRRYPVFGPFISFKWNVAKIIGNQARQAIKEMGGSGGGRRTPPPPPRGGAWPKMFPGDADKQTRARGVQRALTLLTALSIPTLLYTIWRNRAKIKESQVKALQKTYPEWRRNNLTLYWRAEKDGELMGTDLTYIWPSGDLEKATRSLMKLDFESFKEALSFGDNPIISFWEIVFQGMDPRWHRRIPGGVPGRLAKFFQDFYVPSSSPVPSIPGLILHGKLEPGWMTGYQAKRLYDSWNGKEYTESPSRELKGFLSAIRTFTIRPRELMKNRLEWLRSHKSELGAERYKKERKEILDLRDEIEKEWHW